MVLIELLTPASSLVLGRYAIREPALQQARRKDRNGENDQRPDHRGQRKGDAADREAEIGGSQRREEILRLQAPRLENRGRRHDQKDDPGEPLNEHDDLRQHVAADAQHGDEPRAGGRVRLQQHLGAVTHDDVDQVEGAAKSGQEQRLIDEERGERDIAGRGRDKEDEGGDPSQCPEGRERIGLGRGLGVKRRRELAQRMGCGERDDEGAQRPRRHRKVEREDRVCGRLDHALDRPDRRNRQDRAENEPRGAVADRNDPPDLGARRQHCPADKHWS